MNATPRSSAVPYRARDVERVLRKHGATIDRGAGKGSHAKVRHPDNPRPYVLPLGGGGNKELSDRYIDALCRWLNCDRDAFISELQRRKK